MCDACEALGYGVCDRCGNPTWDRPDNPALQNRFWVEGVEICGYCKPSEPS